ncbi:L-carnitine dehydratase/bile acid-inducible protein F [Parvibaculum lavamentivorans DS-1]|uniref:L-carnitine dehydratase/bile acid-inducible protein F n=1 Tax=Parvibaculum lavamentivorans (strain DS-1 / DSM 13023 / NCIMB 13966) TaxID=402881 RepID=A7HRX7_PARL1|nr:CoA transferase [Parvibaculum lavamentivorans]ABS62660.1 L-carnitine dehydratase/bile acid-inducible protein F [Parvibaculum lavamentivorans DS-1]
MLPLQGIRVIDLTTVAMGPLASQWLGDFGADVIKIEAPDGDSTRQTGPSTEAGMATMFLSANRNKRSVVLDLKEPEARETLERLINSADVFMHNIRPQKLERLGLEPEKLIERNPRLVYAGLHGFGEAGPYGGRPAYDDIIQGLSGCADLMRRQTGEPQYFPTITADKTTGLVAAMAILAALTGRATSGRGAIVEVPMFECMVGFNLLEHLYGRQFVPPHGNMGYPRVLSRHRRPYRTSDGFICMLPYTDAHWHAFFVEAGAAEHAADPRFVTMSARTTNIDELYELAAGLIAQYSTGHWLAACERIGVPAAPVLSLDDLIEDPHLDAVDFFSELHDPALGDLLMPGVPVLFDGERPPVGMPPRLGQHNDEVLGEGGISKIDAEEPRARGPSED